MKTSKVIHTGLAVALLGAFAASAQASRSGSERYDVILERKPFGAIPVRAAAPVEVEPAAPLHDAENPPRGAFIETLRICAMTETDFGLRVGIVDIKSKPQAVYFLYPGEDEGGITVVDADFAGERALLSKEGESYWLGMNDKAGGGATPAKNISAKRGVTKASNNSTRLSYASRLKQRRDLEAKRMEKLNQPLKISGKELEKHLQKMQMDAIRSGSPALPIPLTAEMDDKLVAEGVLEPLE